MGGDHAIVEPTPAEIVTDGRIDPDALGTLGMTLTTDPAPEERWELPLEALFDDRLAEQLAACAASLEDVDAPVVGAFFSKSVSTVVAPGVLSAWTLADVGLEASPGNLALHMDGPHPRCCRILDPGLVTVGRPDRDLSLQTLMGETLEPLFAAITRETGVSAETQWSNVGNLVAFLYDQLHHHGIPGDHAADRSHLLDRETAAWRSGPNPIEDPVRYERFDAPDVPDRYQVRHVCCLKREIPDEQACMSCPTISHAQRRARLEERGSHT